jgi:hypothetical protein
MKLPFQMCAGCGSSWNDERLTMEKKSNPKLISCCPDRKMVDVYTHPAKILTDEEIRALHKELIKVDVPNILTFAKAILRKAQEK